MESEQQGAEPQKRNNALIAIVASGLFLACVLVAGLFLFYPKDATDTSSAAATAQPQTHIFDPVEYLKNGDQNISDSLQFSPEQDTKDRSADAEIAIIVTDSKPTIRQQQKQPQPPQTDDTAPPPASTRTIRTPDSPTPPQQIHSQTKRATIQQTTAVSPSQPTTTDQATASAISLYWIQIFSSDAYEGAQRARIRLAQYQIDGVITKHAVHAKTYYRLRVGPFHNYNEAQKFLTWFNDSKIFEDSIVVQISNRSN